MYIVQFFLKLITNLENVFENKLVNNAIIFKFCCLFLSPSMTKLSIKCQEKSITVRGGGDVFVIRPLKPVYFYDSYR